MALALTSICPVEVLKNTKPDGLEVNVPVAPPGIVANISLPVWHNVEGEQLNEALSVGFTVMVQVMGVPEQLLKVGVTVIVAVIGTAPVFVAVNPEIFPVPLAANPIAVFEFDQANVPPNGVLTKLVEEINPLLQTVIFPGLFTVGIGFTVTAIVAVPVHPEAVPVKVYVVVDDGVTETGVPPKLPGIHPQVVPPTELLALNEDEDPLHIVDNVAEGVTTGFGLTVIAIVEVPVQPETVPDKVYVVVDDGVTETGVPLKIPGIHV